MLCNIIKTILKENTVTNSVKEVDMYYSKMKNRKVLTIEFDEEVNYADFLEATKYIISENDISLQDSNSITIDITENIVNKILEYAKMVCIDEFDRIKK